MEQLQKIQTHFFESLRYIFFQTVRRKKPFRNRGYSPLSIPRAVGRLHARARTERFRKFYAAFGREIKKKTGPVHAKIARQDRVRSTVTSRSCHTRVRCSLKGLPGDLAITVKPIDCYRRSSAGFDRIARPRTGCTFETKAIISTTKSSTPGTKT